MLEVFTMKDSFNDFREDIHTSIISCTFRLSNISASHLDFYFQIVLKALYLSDFFQHKIVDHFFVKKSVLLYL